MSRRSQDSFVSQFLTLPSGCSCGYYYVKQHTLGYNPYKYRYRIWLHTLIIYSIYIYSIYIYSIYIVYIYTRYIFIYIRYIEYIYIYEDSIQYIYIIHTYSSLAKHPILQFQRDPPRCRIPSRTIPRRSDGEFMVCSMVIYGDLMVNYQICHLFLCEKWCFNAV
jgi:hypothetical protein